MTRVEDAIGRHIEPAFDSSWDEQTKLRWKAALVAHDTGLTIRLHPHGGPGGHIHYGLTIGEINEGGQSSLSVGPYPHAWDALTYISIGAEAVQRANPSRQVP
ncbi:hypothetical protein [Streptomyces iakyrus]|uniref:hypothetical protein n=1 Tax=Streptomyces iakyrus TaxID=68219 RepID=UPI0036AC20EC